MQSSDVAKGLIIFRTAGPSARLMHEIMQDVVKCTKMSRDERRCGEGQAKCGGHDPRTPSVPADRSGRSVWGMGVFSDTDNLNQDAVWETHGGRDGGLRDLNEFSSISLHLNAMRRPYDPVLSPCSSSRRTTQIQDYPSLQARVLQHRFRGGRSLLVRHLLPPHSKREKGLFLCSSSEYLY